MVVLFKPSFVKDCRKLPEKIRQEVEEVCFNIFPKISGLAEFKLYPLRKIRGFRFYWRIKIGNYRIGFRKNGSEVVFMRVLPRKDIYRYFP